MKRNDMHARLLHTVLGYHADPQDRSRGERPGGPKLSRTHCPYYNNKQMSFRFAMLVYSANVRPRPPLA